MEIMWRDERLLISKHVSSYLLYVVSEMIRNNVIEMFIFSSGFELEVLHAQMCSGKVQGKACQTIEK